MNQADEGGRMERRGGATGHKSTLKPPLSFSPSELFFFFFFWDIKRNKKNQPKKKRFGGGGF